MHVLNDILCFSHLRWDFVFQRPQHLMTRFSSRYRVFFIEEPVYDASEEYYDIRKDQTHGVWIVVPHLHAALSSDEIVTSLRQLINHVIQAMNISDYVCWYYTPLALQYSDHLQPNVLVYDCMDELSAFKFAHPELTLYEELIMQHADVVFTGGQSLYEAKKHKHANIFAFPSSVDRNHFIAARTLREEPQDQKTIPHPRLGFFGVIDERFDIDLVHEVAVRRPDLHFIFIGPIVKINPEDLPSEANIHYLGQKDYRQLPQYLSGWDIAIMPFARNESTRYISPTKTPEYLWGGQPVISTSIQDVINPYGKLGLVEIADTPAEFIDAVDTIMNSSYDEYVRWLDGVDQFLSENSCDNTVEAMDEQIRKSLVQKSHHENSRQHV